MATAKKSEQACPNCGGKLYEASSNEDGETYRCLGCLGAFSYGTKGEAKDGEPAYAGAGR